MDTNALKKFAQAARNLLIDQVTARLDLVLTDGAPARREHPVATRKLEVACAKNRQQVIEQAAYTWFNRFTALRFMDAAQITNPRVVSPADGATRPEILAEATGGNLPEGVRPEVADYLNGSRPAHDGQAEAYRLLVIHACNHWHGAMPFMFERAEDYTELLMPDDLLSPNSILARLRSVMTDEACQDVEIIGWLYQFYISEKKDQVFAGLKKNVKITAENIPAATQLFTPHWIVRYLVENSLGRLWLLNRPQSKLAEKMDYYIAPIEPEIDFLRITGPEEIRICDPACGSGHMLTYAFDLLHEIYAEEGYDAAEIPGLILTHNLTGIEIDDRAGALAAFALSMKAAERLGRRRFLRMQARPDIVVLQNVTFTPAEMQDVAALVGRDLFTDELRQTLLQFEQAKNYGSLIVPKLRDPAETLRVVEVGDFGGDLLLKEVQARVVAVLHMAEALLPKYHVVVANPPYAGIKGLNPRLTEWLKSNFADSKNDLMTAFMDRASLLGKSGGFWAMINLPSWMFLSTFEKLRTRLLGDQKIETLLQLGRGVFGSDFGSAAFVFRKKKPDISSAGAYKRLFKRSGDVQKISEIECNFRSEEYPVHFVEQSAFHTIPGSPIAFWVNKELRSIFAEKDSIADLAKPMLGMRTGNNDRFLRYWQEVDRGKTGLGFVDAKAAKESGKKWMPYNKGGEYRKWFGNNDLLVNWETDGYEVKSSTLEAYPQLSWDNLGWKISNESHFFKRGITWTTTSASFFGVRQTDEGALFDVQGSSMFPEELDQPAILGALASKPTHEVLKILNPTIVFQPRDIGNVPFPLDRGSMQFAKVAEEIVPAAVTLSRSDWDAYETSWDFTTLPLLSRNHRTETLTATYAALRAHWQGMTDAMQRLEEENNRIFIEAYGLQDELTPEVPIEEITLACNPAYRYGVKTSEPDREARLREDTIAEFLHYAVGCMFGRYSLDAPGLILANQGDGIEEYQAKIPEPCFAPDRDNVIPVLDDDWFADDIVARFRDFLRLTFGEAKFRENLAFIEDGLGKDLRKWFTKDFFDYHVRRYKKRPIYWMFSSPKGSFNALIYMHRYRPDTVSVVLNQYLREFITKLETERTRLEKLADDASATQSQRTKALKDVGGISKQIDELTAWERDVVYPLAQKRVPIDLDDGVKQNYPLFGEALKPIKGLEAADE
ncbi:BREX-1 system adenine-specific DNA-methyltransferase PglX [Rhizobium leguminosarum]|uniref:BREX-1 system adenine-specific DNA-methyltransferase PglX n=1 Tax=Rhizobium leguminosarum TaxID=384 RepID=UPI00103D88A6|nr:BREX-1 system adenine-specific DNA-methyltransferase PglX [Rhizobium leguminosarum]TCA10316.1 BREX-1 system adenine-specific DNA-methyltransferase PglX [Rhizobium leguminosarum bv. viciae]